MTTDDARRLIGVFGEVHANGTLYPRWINGRITEVDRSHTAFTDIMGGLHIFRTSKIVEFVPKALRSITWFMPKKNFAKELKVLSLHNETGGSNTDLGYSEAGLHLSSDDTNPQPA